MFLRNLVIDPFWSIFAIFVVIIQRITYVKLELILKDGLSEYWKLEGLIVNYKISWFE